MSLGRITGFRETNMGYTCSPVRTTMGNITSQRHERLKVESKEGGCMEGAA